MAWWDHEELKNADDRSEKYKNMFPEEYLVNKPRRIQTVPENKSVDEVKFVGICQNVVPEQTMVFYNKEELISFVSDKKDREWKFYRLGDEVEVKTTIVSVSNLRINHDPHYLRTPHTTLIKPQPKR